MAVFGIKGCDLRMDPGVLKELCYGWPTNLVTLETLAYKIFGILGDVTPVLSSECHILVKYIPVN